MRRGGTLTEKEGAVVWAEAGEGTCWHGKQRSKCPECRGEEEAAGGEGRGREEREKREKQRRGEMASTTQSWKKCTCITERGASVWTVGTPSSARAAGGVAVRTAESPPSASTTERGASARTAGTSPSVSTTEGEASVKDCGGASK